MVFSFHINIIVGDIRIHYEVSVFEHGASVIAQLLDTHGKLVWYCGFVCFLVECGADAVF